MSATLVHYSKAFYKFDDPFTIIKLILIVKLLNFEYSNYFPVAIPPQKSENVPA